MAVNRHYFIDQIRFLYAHSQTGEAKPLLKMTHQTLDFFLNLSTSVNTVTKKTGTKKMANSVPVTMPPNTPVPIAC